MLRWRRVAAAVALTLLGLLFVAALVEHRAAAPDDGRLARGLHVAVIAEDNWRTDALPFIVRVIAVDVAARTLVSVSGSVTLDSVTAPVLDSIARLEQTPARWHKQLPDEASLHLTVTDQAGLSASSVCTLHPSRRTDPQPLWRRATEPSIRSPVVPPSAVADVRVEQGTVVAVVRAHEPTTVAELLIDGRLRDAHMVQTVQTVQTVQPPEPVDVRFAAAPISAEAAIVVHVAAAWAHTRGAWASVKHGTHPAPGLEPAALRPAPLSCAQPPPPRIMGRAFDLCALCTSVLTLWLGFRASRRTGAEAEFVGVPRWSAFVPGIVVAAFLGAMMAVLRL